MSDFRDYLNMKWVYPKLIDKHQELEKAGKLQKCYKILAPIITIEVDIVQTPNESFEEIEKLIMRLIGATVKENEEIANLTGIPSNYIENIKSLLITQKLLTEDGNRLTESGKISLKIGEKQITTIEKRRFQVNGITSTIMPKKFQIYKNELLKIEQLKPYELYQNPACEMMDVIEDYTWEEMEENIRQYVEVLNEISSSNIQKMSINQILEHSYTYFFLLEFEKLQQPILVAKSKKFLNDKMEFYYEPLWVYEKDASFLGIEEKEIIGKKKVNMIHFKTKIDEIYQVKEEKVKAYLEKWHVKSMIDRMTYEIELKENKYDKDLLFQIENIGNQKPKNPIFPEDKAGLNGEVFYFYTKDSVLYEDMKEISKVLGLYMKEVKDKYGSAKVENYQKENRDIVERITNQLPEISKEKIQEYLEEIKK